MEFIQAQKECVKAKPIAVGVSAVLATLSLGMALSFALGFASPQAALAQAIPIPCPCGIPPVIPPPVIIPPPIVPPVIIPPVVPPIVLAPSCKLSISGSSIDKGDSVTLTWAVANGAKAFIDQGIGSVSVEGGSKAVSPTVDTKYTLTVVGVNGATIHCDTSVKITTPPPSHITPACTLNISASSIVQGGSATITWTSTNAQSVSLYDQTAGTYFPGVYANGDTTITPSKSSSYLFTAVSSTGDQVTCPASITVTPPPPSAPVCTLAASPTSITKGDSSTLTWTTSNAKTFSIDQSIGLVTPVAGGAASVSPTATTTYTGTATSLDGKTTTTCTAQIVVKIPPSPQAPTCTLTASPTTVNSGDTSKLTWTTTNAKTFVIDQGIGAVTPIAGGSASTSAITANTTFTGTATSADGQTVTCTAAVTVPPPSGLACTLSAADSSVSPGGKTSLTWTTNGASTFSLDNGIGLVTPIKGGSTTTQSINNDIVYTGTATDSTGKTATCNVTITVTTPGCRSGCGGGGGGGHPVNVTLDTAPTQPLAFVYLSQIPYTGLDLGPIGTFLYWLLLALWSAALAYLAIFKLVPFLKDRMQGFGAAVSEALNAEIPEDARRYAYAAPTAQRAPEMPAAPVQPVMRSAAPAPEAASTYSAYQGFKSFGREGALTIDDIVKGLSRQKSVHAAPAAHANVEPAYENVEAINDRVEPIYENVEEIAPASAPAKPARQEAPKAAPAAEVPAFLALVLAGDRDGAFSMIRSIVREGGDAESFLTQVAVALDDAYRARLDGTAVHGEIARVTGSCATPFLEKLVAAFSTGVDSTYSQGITGAKLAVARALGVVEG
jgi:hypothetical protein